MTMQHLIAKEIARLEQQIRYFDQQKSVCQSKIDAFRKRLENFN